MKTNSAYPMQTEWAKTTFRQNTSLNISQPWNMECAYENSYGLNSCWWLRHCANIQRWTDVIWGTYSIPTVKNKKPSCQRVYIYKTTWLYSFRSGFIHSDTWKIGSRSVNNFKVKVKFSQGQSVIKILLSTTKFVLFSVVGILEVNVVVCYFKMFSTYLSRIAVVERGRGFVVMNFARVIEMIKYANLGH